MGRLRHIHLEDIPWPISILKFNQAVSEMRPGDHLIAFLRDTDVMANLRQLLRHQPDVVVVDSTSGEDRCLEVKKQSGAATRSAATDNHKYR